MVEADAYNGSESTAEECAQHHGSNYTNQKVAKEVALSWYTIYALITL